MADASNVEVFYTGAVYVAPAETALPTDGTTALDAAYEDVGYIHEDGLTETTETSTETIKAWQRGMTIRKVQTDHEVTYAFTMLESNPTVLREYYGNHDPGGAEADEKVKVNGKELPHRRWVLSLKDGDKVRRVVIPDGQITDRGEVSYSNDDATAYEVTITAYPVEDIDDPDEQMNAVMYMATVAEA